MPDLKPGIYFESENGKWEGCVCDAHHDAAYLFYADHPHCNSAEVACGGFSSRATNCLSYNVKSIIDELGEPQFETGDLRVGLFVIQFDVTASPGDAERGPGWVKAIRVVRIPEEVLVRRLERRSFRRA